MEQTMEDLSREITRLKAEKRRIEDRLEAARADLFSQINTRARDRAQTLTVYVEEVSDVTKRYPQFEMLSITPEDDHYRVEIREKPEYIGFEFVNREGYTITRRANVPKPKLDLGRVKTEDPEMYAAVVQTKLVEELDEEALGHYLDDHPEALSVLESCLLAKPPVMSLVTSEPEK